MEKDNTLLGELPTYKKLLRKGKNLTDIFDDPTFNRVTRRCFVRPEECPSQCPTTYERCEGYQSKLKAFPPKYKNE